MSKKLTGIYPALVTPFTKDGHINHESLRQIVQLNLKKGVQGFYVGGSTAEAFLLNMEERKSILKTVADEAQGKAALIYHIGCIHTDHAVELGKFAAGVGVNAISSVAPFYYKFSFAEIRDYYFEIMKQVHLPMIIYNFPALSGVTFSMENIKQLTANPQVTGIKHTSYDLYQLEQMKTIDNDRLTIFNGHDEVFLGGLALGADGAIGSTYNFMAEKFVTIAKLYESKQMQEAKQIQIEANRIIDLLIEGGVFPGIKYILGLMGIDCGECRKPFHPVSDSIKKQLRRITEANNYFGAK
jgi:N-acetylneuraminate lyase